MKKAYTLIELLVTIAIVLIFCFLIFFGMAGYFSYSNGEKINPLFFPVQAQAQAQQDLAKQIEEQNRLTRELIKQQK